MAVTKSTEGAIRRQKRHRSKTHRGAIKKYGSAIRATPNKKNQTRRQFCISRKRGSESAAVLHFATTRLLGRSTHESCHNAVVRLDSEDVSCSSAFPKPNSEDVHRGRSVPEPDSEDAPRRSAVARRDSPSAFVEYAFSLLIVRLAYFDHAPRCLISPQASF